MGSLTREDKVWFAKLAWILLNCIVYALGDGASIQSYRREEEYRNHFTEHAEK